MRKAGKLQPGMVQIWVSEHVTTDSPFKCGTNWVSGQQEAPLTFSPRQFDGGFWNVVRYEDISEIEKNVEVFSSRTNVSPLEVVEAQLANTIDRSIILCDPP